jgi:hypothetical protein
LYPKHWYFSECFLFLLLRQCGTNGTKMHKLQWNTWFKAQVLVYLDQRSSIWRETWIMARKHHSAWSVHTSCPVGVQMVTSYVSLQHHTHTGPFHASLNHCSGQLLSIDTLPVYCHTSVLAILSFSAWPVKMNALCFFEMSGTNAPVTRHHNPEDSNRDRCGERLRSCKHRIDSNADVCLSMIMLMSFVMLGGKYSKVTHCIYLLFLNSSSLLYKYCGRCGLGLFGPW